VQPRRRRAVTRTAKARWDQVAKGLLAMAEEIAFVVVTPYTISKSRTGAILSRLLGRLSAELIATQIFAVNQEMADRYAASVPPGPTPEDEHHRRMIRDYIAETFSPLQDGQRRRRALLLVFRGENACQEVADVVGRIRISSASGETIRDTYGDLIYKHDGTVRYFEPAVLTSDCREHVRADLQMWMDFAATQPAVLDRVCTYDNPAAVEQTLVLIKPDSWRQRSSRPGAIVDMFSRTGLRIIAMKLCRINVRQGLDFYGPVRDVLRAKLAPGIGAKARLVLEKELGLTLAPEIEQELARSVGIPYAENQFERIVEFMTGVAPSQCRPEDMDADGKVKCLALVYEGENAVRKIRDVLGPTDPTKAPGGTVRSEFGSNIMVNTAHASDSAENARREMGILKLHEGNFLPIVNKALAELKL
jgi:nucleoside diphosphate kinase